MANEEIKLSDPLGNTIFLLPGTGLSSQEKNAPDIYDDIVAVIQKPAILIRVSGETDELFYYRSVAWHHTMLLVVRFQNGRWETAECFHNPSAEVLSDLLKKGKQLI